MDDREIIRACRDAGFSDREWNALTYESGPYSITEPTVVLKNLVEIIVKSSQKISRPQPDNAQEEQADDPETCHY